MVIGALVGFSNQKRRPAPHRLEHILTRQNSGFYVARLPRPYPINSAQRRVRDVARSCGIAKGMSRSALVHTMIDCVGPAMRK